MKLNHQQKLKLPKRADFIFCGDLHLRTTVPAGRKEGFLEQMWKKLQFIGDLQQHYGCPILNTGDTFDTWKGDRESKQIEMLQGFVEAIRGPFITVFGQHEMPNHSVEQFARSPLQLLKLTGTIEVATNQPIHYGKFRIYGSSWGDRLEDSEHLPADYNSILLIHKLVWQKEPFPGAPKSGNCDNILKKHGKHKLVACGDNHEGFLYKNLLNCGSMMRSTIAQKEYVPVVWVWDCVNDSSPVPVPLPIQQDVWTEKVTHVSLGGERFEVLDDIQGVLQGGDNFESKIKDKLKGENPSVKRKVKGLL